MGLLRARFLMYVGVLTLLLWGCVAVTQQGTKGSKYDMIITPISYYTSDKAKELGTRYADDLVALVSRVRENPATKELKFLNNIQSPGGIGFFTHSETYLPDERYLEVAVILPGSLKLEQNLRHKIDQLFPKFGLPLFKVLLSDSDIYQDSRVDGYGVSLTWQQLNEDRSLSRESIVIYAPKEKTRQVVDEEIPLEQFLKDSVIFEREGGRWVRRRL